MDTATTQIGLQTKLPKIEESIFSVMSALANKHKAVNLSQGFPNFPCSEELIKLVNKYMKAGYNQYAPAYGVAELRAILAKKIHTLYDKKINAEDEITITAGGTQAIFTSIVSLIKEGDEVIVFEPAYDSYVPSIKVAGGMPISIALKGPDYRIPWQEVKQKMSFKTKMIVINTPHNPCGTILNEEDIEQLKIITEGTDILILSDEVYEHITFDGQKHLSMLSTDLANRSICVYSFGKVLHATGWKVGYCVAPKYIMKEIRKTHQFNVFSVNTPVQYAIADYYKNAENYLGVSALYEQKRNFFLDLMKESRFTFVPTNSTYFQLMNYSEISNEADTEFARKLTIENGVATIPISVFYSNKTDDKVIRVCFAKTEDTLKKAADKLCKI